MSALALRKCKTFKNCMGVFTEFYSVQETNKRERKISRRFKGQILIHYRLQEICPDIFPSNTFLVLTPDTANTNASLDHEFDKQYEQSIVQYVNHRLFEAFGEKAFREELLQDDIFLAEESCSENNIATPLPPHSHVSLPTFSYQANGCDIFDWV